MIWLTWRQARTQFLVMFGVAAAIAIVLAATGPHIASAFDSDPTQFLSRYAPGSLERDLYFLGLVMYAVPAVIGVFWGAPLIAREVESGTHRLVWGQSITRRRWLAMKLALTGLAAVAVSGLMSLALTWWASPIDKAIGQGYGTGLFNAPRLDSVIFGTRAIVPIGYTLFAFALGVVVGLVVRRTVPAMAITLAAVVFVQILIPSMIREHLVTPVTITTAITQDNLEGMLISGPPGDHEKIGKNDTIDSVDSIRVDATKRGDWELANQTITQSGKVAGSLPGWVADCGGPPPGQDDDPTAERKACFARLAAEGYQQKVTYHPASVFWSMQWRESGLLVAAALVLTGFAFWRIRRDL